MTKYFNKISLTIILFILVLSFTQCGITKDAVNNVNKPTNTTEVTKSDEVKNETKTDTIKDTTIIKDDDKTKEPEMPKEIKSEPIVEPVIESVVNINKADYYVSNSGLDTNDGKSIDTPFKTIQKAVDNVKAGETICVRGGTYSEKITMKTSGTENKYITLKNYEGETPIINGSGQKLSEDDYQNGLILINNQSYIKVIGFDVTNYISKNAYVPAGIRVVGVSKNIEIRNCKVYGIKTTYSGSNEDRNAHGIAVHGTDGNNPVDGLVIDNCEVYDCILGQSESVVLNGNVTNFTVSNNKIYDNDNIGIDFIGYEGTSNKNDYARNGLCYGNQVWNISSGKNNTYNGDACADGMYVDGGSNITIEKNKVWNVDIGIEAASEHRNKATDNVIIRNNLIYNCGLYGISIGGSGDTNGKATNIKVYNNTAYNNDVNMNIQNYCQYSSNVIKNNIFYKGTIYDGIKTNIVISNNITSDPKFVNVNGLDFHLQDGSSAINIGINEDIIGTADLDGKTRIVGEKVDCGCYEKQ